MKNNVKDTHTHTHRNKDNPLPKHKMLPYTICVLKEADCDAFNTNDVLFLCSNTCSTFPLSVKKTRNKTEREMEDGTAP